MENKPTDFIAHLSVSEFREFNGPFFIQPTNVPLLIEDSVTILKENWINGYVMRLSGPIEENNTISLSNIGDRVGFVSDDIDYNKPLEFSAFIDKKGQVQWILQNKNLKPDADEIREYLKQKEVNCFYHFTDSRNLESIRRHGGLYSWFSCEKKGITVQYPGGSSLSRKLDKKHGLEDYRHLSFCNNHPMIDRLTKECDYDLVVLRIAVDVAFLPQTLFCDRNATNTSFQIGKTIRDLKAINIEATKERFVSRSSVFFQEHQAEVLVKTHVPLEYIDINDPFKPGAWDNDEPVEPAMVFL